MYCTVRSLVIATLVALAPTTENARAQTWPYPGQQPFSDSPFLTTNRILQASLQRISNGSALWRAAIEAVRKTGRHAVVVTISDVTMEVDRHRWNADAFDPSALAEAVPVLRGDLQVAGVVVVVNLGLIQEIHDSRLSVPRHFEADLDRILVHEIYGHGVPYLLAGNLSGRCADPKPGDRASEACSIRRENAVRAELGLGRRDDPGLSSLTLAWGRTR